MNSKNIKIPAYGYSMFPFFISGDILYLKTVLFKKIQVNDFVTFKQKKLLVTHRVVYIPQHKKFLITKGDANSKHDGKIKPEQIAGKVIKITREGKLFTPDTLYSLQSSMYKNEINKINNILTEERIDYVFLKGLPLHLFYEKTIPKRLYADCDILIKRDHLAITHQLLTRIGYTPYDDSLSFAHKLLKNKENAINYYKNVNGMPITFDIHIEASFMLHQVGRLDALYPQHLLDSFTKQLLSKKRIIFTDGFIYPILSSYNLVIYLALHLFHHNLQGYYRYEFLRIILKKEKLQMHTIKTCITSYKLTSFVYPVFLLLNRYYKNTQAEKILDSLQPSKNTMRTAIAYTKSVDIFNDDWRINAGIQRFKLIFSFSPNSIFKKLTIFLSPAVIYSIVWVSIKKTYEYHLSLLLRLKHSSIKLLMVRSV